MMIAFALSITLALQAEPTVPGPPQGAFFALSVADVGAVSRWYVEKLGFHVHTSGEAPNKIAKFALLNGDGTWIEVIQHRDAAPRTTGPDAVRAHGIFKIGLVVADLDRVYREVRARDVPIAYELTKPRDVPLRTFSVRDVEGNHVQFFGR